MSKNNKNQKTGPKVEVKEEDKEVIKNIEEVIKEEPKVEVKEEKKNPLANKEYTYFGGGLFAYKDKILKTGDKLILTEDEFNTHFKVLNLFR